jgi:hypothetical protein
MREQMAWDKFKPEEKVNLAISMSSVCVRICADGIRDRQPTITDEELIEEVRKRIMYAKRHRCEG